MATLLAQDKDLENHICYQEEFLGRVKEFMDSTKGVRFALITIAVSIALQVVTFAYLWGGLTRTVQKNTDYLWGEVTADMKQNTRSLDKLLAKLDGVRIVSLVGNRGEKSDKDDKGEKVDTSLAIVTRGDL